MRIERRKPLEANVGILGVGHHTYWSQFEGLLDRMTAKYNRMVDTYFKSE